MHSVLENDLLRLKHLVSAGLVHFGVNGLVKSYLKRHHGNLPVVTALCYHAVPKEHVRSFELQLDYLAENNFFPLSGESLIDLMILPQKYKEHGKYVCLTFDDCYESNYTILRPILLKRRLPAIFFAVSSRLGEFPDWDDGCGNKERLMTGEQLQEMALDFEIGGHTKHHVKLGEARPGLILDEVERSKDELRNLLGKEVSFFSYPNGSYNARVLECVESCGFDAAFTIDQHSNYSYRERYALGRYLIDPGDIHDFKLKVLGGYDWFYFAIEPFRDRKIKH